jgi:hypothetical protein
VPERPGANAPSAAELWAERKDRALDALGYEGHWLEADLCHAWLRIRCDLTSEQVVVDGRRVDNPHVGDEGWARAEARRLWGDLGRALGIGEPPPAFFGDG